MRVLILGPNHPGGSLPPYLDALTTGLREIGVLVDRHGSTAIPYDQDSQRFWSIERIVASARALADQIDPAAYDVVALHAGNLEIDHLVAAFWPRRSRPPIVYHIHTLDPTLFRDHVPHARWHRVVREQITGADGYVYFGQHAEARLAVTSPALCSGQVAWLPTTIPDGTLPSPSPALAAALHVPHGLPVISLYGFAAPWKDAGLLTAALRLMRQPVRVVVAGQFWDDATAPTAAVSPGKPVRIGVTEFTVVAEYVDAAGRAALIRASAAGVFPYRDHPSFQGSGAIADYLAHNVPVIATDVANMAELIGDAGYVVPANDPVALAAALDMIVTKGSTATEFADQACRRAHRFSAAAHATRCVRLYQQVIDRGMCRSS
ncbi:glycosyltransferase family 4 protein [Nocardia salmonicida]|uniref:glycosyltransferase family 4 protein n=1 Tax=Nocardia salmonicida TaxID=53431 RepID=UPI0007A4FD7A|nr:glycosyltransferase [Nocardia salmonicida]MBC7299449.1 glycosyltransferase [Nocardia sp.]